MATVTCPPCVLGESVCRAASVCYVDTQWQPVETFDINSNATIYERPNSHLSFLGAAQYMTNLENLLRLRNAEVKSAFIGLHDAHHNNRSPGLEGFMVCDLGFCPERRKSLETHDAP